jgi:hypothetical protein
MRISHKWFLAALALSLPRWIVVARQTLSHRDVGVHCDDAALMLLLVATGNNSYDLGLQNKVQISEWDDR